MNYDQNLTIQAGQTDRLKEQWNQVIDKRLISLSSHYQSLISEASKVADLTDKDENGVISFDYKSDHSKQYEYSLKLKTQAYLESSGSLLRLIRFLKQCATVNSNPLDDESVTSDDEMESSSENTMSEGED